MQSIASILDNFVQKKTYKKSCNFVSLCSFTPQPTFLLSFTKYPRTFIPNNFLSTYTCVWYSPEIRLTDVYNIKCITVNSVSPSRLYKCYWNHLFTSMHGEHCARAFYQWTKQKQYEKYSSAICIVILWWTRNRSYNGLYFYGALKFIYSYHYSLSCLYIW